MKRKALRVLKADSETGRRALRRLLRRSELVLDGRLRGRVRRLLRDIRREGDDALRIAVANLDGYPTRRPSELAMAPAPEDAGWGEVPEPFIEALDGAIEAVTRFHEVQLRADDRLERDGVELVERRRPLRRVGIYIPGGRASYPSTALMTVIPAQLAGVDEVVVATPPVAYCSMPALRYTLDRLGVREIWGMGGAQAVAALAYGTESIRRVDKIVGPGNAWVTAAKREVAGDVAIDSLAGPTEVVIVAEAGANPSWLAADLLAQAEHDPLAAAVLITPDRELGRAVAAEVESQLSALTTAETARAALTRFGGCLVVEDLAAALDLVDQIAPEHLQLVGEGAEALVERVRNAGSVFLGAATSEVFGDYVAGPSHVLPTCGSARFTSALGIDDFIRRSHCVRFDPAAARRWAEAAATLAEAEGLPAHAAAARRRLES